MSLKFDFYTILADPARFVARKKWQKKFVIVPLILGATRFSKSNSAPLVGNPTTSDRGQRTIHLP